MTLETSLQAITSQLSAWVQPPGINEAQTSQAIILRLFYALGYDIWNPLEVIPEMPGNGGYRPDYTIALAGDVRFIVEVKHLGKNLADTEKDMTQAVSYINSRGKRWAILTSGQEWLFFDNDIRGETAQKRVLTIDLLKHKKHVAGYLEQLLSKQHWQRNDAEDALEAIIQHIQSDIDKHQQLNRIREKLRNKIGYGFSKDRAGLETAIKYELDPDERQLAEAEFEVLHKRLLGDLPSTSEVSARQSNPKTTTPQPLPSSLEAIKQAIIAGINSTQALQRTRETSNFTARIDEQVLNAMSWRDIHAGIAEALISLNRQDILNSLLHVHSSMDERRKHGREPYPKIAYRQLGNGSFIFLHYGAQGHRRKCLELLEALGVHEPFIEVTYKGVLEHLPPKAS